MKPTQSLKCQLAGPLFFLMCLSDTNSVHILLSCGVGEAVQMEVDEHFFQLGTLLWGSALMLQFSYCLDHCGAYVQHVASHQGDIFWYECDLSLLAHRSTVSLPLILFGVNSLQFLEELNRTGSTGILSYRQCSSGSQEKERAQSRRCAEVHRREEVSQWDVKRLEDGVQRKSQDPSCAPAPTQRTCMHICKAAHAQTLWPSASLCRKTETNTSSILSVSQVNNSYNTLTGEPLNLWFSPFPRLTQ